MSKYCKTIRSEYPYCASLILVYIYTYTLPGEVPGFGKGIHHDHGSIGTINHTGNLGHSHPEAIGILHVSRLKFYKSNICHTF